MRAQKIIIPVILVAMIFGLTTVLGAAGQKEKAKQQPKPQPQEKVFIPKDIKAVMAEGLATKQGRQDIPVNIFYSLYLPAQQNFHDIFFLKIKNAALDFVVPPPAPPAKEPVKKGPQVTTAQEPPQLLQANFNLFFQFNLVKEGAPPEDVKEVYVPCTIQVPSAGFDPEKEDIYSFGYPMPAGHYLLAVAVTSVDLKKIGTAYYDFSVPDASSYAKSLGTTPVFFIKEMEQMEAVENRTYLHRGSFTYSVLRIVPNIDKVFSAGDNLDIFFYIFGTQVNAQNQSEIEINYEVMKDKEASIRWAPQSYTNPLISQPLPLKQTLNIKDEKGERTESRDLPPGNYTVVINITDKVSGKTGVEKIDFTMK